MQILVGMTVAAFWLKWGLRFYPPLFFQRIWVKQISSDFRYARVKINRSLLNRNVNHSIFGGTLFAASDPFYPVMFHQLFTRKGYKVIAWSKSASIHFVKPGDSDLFFEVKIDEEAIARSEDILNNEGKYIETFTIEMFNKQGEQCVIVQNELYLRNLNFIETNTEDNVSRN